MQALASPRKKCAMKMKESIEELEKIEKVFDGREEFWCLWKDHVMASGEQFLIQLRYYLFSKQVNGCQGDGFLSVSIRTGIIKLAMADT